jgi:hypothetical protein
MQTMVDLSEAYQQIYEQHAFLTQFFGLPQMIFHKLMYMSGAILEGTHVRYLDQRGQRDSRS